MGMTGAGLETLIENSTVIASQSNRNREGFDGGSLWWKCKELYRHKDGRLFFSETGGAGIRVDRGPRWISEDDAIEWIASEAIDGLTGYGYTREGAIALLQGDETAHEWGLNKG